MTITVQIPDDLETALKKLAQDEGHHDLATFVHAILKEKVHQAENANGIQPTSSVDEALADIRQGFKQSGLDEDELDQLFEEAREEVWRDKNQS